MSDMYRYPDFFNDVFGPVMQPGSSSHTAAPCRLGLMARSLLGEPPMNARFVMDPAGSFAGTFGLMNEGNGMLAGVMGIPPEDARLFRAPVIAGEAGLQYQFVFDALKESTHANALKIALTGKSGNTVELVGESTGGGMVHVSFINGYRVDLIGDCYALLVFEKLSSERRDALKAVVKDILMEEELSGTGGAYLLLSSAKPQRKQLREVLEGVPWALLAPILPIVANAQRKQQLFTSIAQWTEIARSNGARMSDVTIQYEMDYSQLSRRQVILRMKRLMQLLTAQIEAAYAADVKHDPSPFARDDCGQWLRYQRAGSVLSGPLTGEIIRRVQGVSAKIPGTSIVPGPMGTGGGYLFSALYSVKEQYGFSEADVLRGLFAAAAVGALAYTHTNPTGEVVGCAGECGVCCAMGAAGIVEMAGGNGEQIGHAASLALQAFIGLPCDPVPGGREAPCFSRVMTAAVMSVVYADLALSGATSVLSYEEMLRAVDNMGRQMPAELLCTSRGGCCNTPSAQECMMRFREWSHTMA